MKISWNYLQSLFKYPLEQKLVLERLTQAGLEVEEINSVAPEFSGIVVGEVVECIPHPAADKLSVCKVVVGSGEPLQIICGASNVKVGVKIPCAKVGAVLPGDFKISERKMRGIVSYGMLCSGNEIGVPDGVDGLLLLPADAPLGADIRKYLDLNDQVVEFKITPNRGDCLSYTGLVREVVALSAAEAIVPALSEDYLQKPAQGFSLKVTAPTECPHYVGLIMHQVNNSATSPEWLIKILARSGIRPISPLVDITNYVMLFLGQPLHAFDLSRLNGGIEVRLGRSGEQLKLIDGKIAEITPETLVIANGFSQTVALAGVMGGLDSGVTPATTAIFLESAFFNPDAVHGKAKQYGVNSEAAFRFERGVDSQIQHTAINIAASLIASICGGVADEFVHFAALNTAPRSIELSFTHINKFIGVVIAPNQIIQILTDLGCGVAANADKLQITVPSYRFDLAIKEDIIEEIIRVYGYDNIQPVMPQLTHTLQSLDVALIKLDNYKQTMVNYGFNEIISYAFIEEKYANLLTEATSAAVKLQNPLAGLNVLRSSLIPDLVKVLQHNVNRGHERVRIFELARVFHGEAPAAQPLYLSGLLSGTAGPLFWEGKPRQVDFYDLRLVLEELLGQFGECEFKATAARGLFHPGRTADIYLNQELIGVIGQLHPRLTTELDLESLPYVFELNLNLIGAPADPQVKPVSKFQKVSRDLALVMKQQVAIGELIAQIHNLQLPELREVRVFDIFSGGTLAEDEKSVAFNLIFQATKTLSDDEVNACLEQIKQLLAVKFAAKLR